MHPPLLLFPRSPTLLFLAVKVFMKQKNYSPLAFSILTVLICVLALALPIDSSAQTAAVRSTAAISGRVSLGDQPAVNVSIELKTTYQSGAMPKTVAKAKTDNEGRYILRELPPGNFTLAPQAAAFVVADSEDETGYRGFGKSIALEEGESLKDINFTMKRGGVITGRITNELGRPVISQPVILTSFGPDGKPVTTPWSGETRINTDDRGIYRFYGLVEGKYLVSCGRSPQSTDLRDSGLGNKNTFYQRVYYPASTTTEEASPVEVAVGSEAANIDIRLGGLQRAFRVSGRLVGGENSAPLTKAILNAERVGRSGFQLTAGFAGSDENGEFFFQGLAPGKYRVRAQVQDAGDLFVPDTDLEIVDEDISDLILKARTGISASGVVTLENTSTAAMPVRPDEIRIGFTVTGDQPTDRSYSLAVVKPDGSFTVTGLRPGRLQIGLSYEAQGKGLALRGVERAGVPLTGVMAQMGSSPGTIEGLMLSKESQLNNLTLRVAYGNCRLRGDVQTADGPLPASTRFQTRIQRTDGAPGMWYTQVDVRGHFTVEGLIPGEYRVTMTVAPGSPELVGFTGVKTVNVSNNTDNTVVVTLAAPGGQQ